MFNVAMIDQVIVSGAAFVTNLLLARYLGLAEFGKFTLLWMVVMFVGSMQQALIVSPMMSIGARIAKESSPEQYNATALLQAIIFSLSVAMLLFGIVGATSIFYPLWNLEGLVWPLCLSASAFLFRDFLRRFYFYQQRQDLALLNDIVSNSLQIGLIVLVFAVLPLSLDTVLLLLALSSFVGILVAFPKISLIVDRATLVKHSKRHWRFGKWQVGSALLFWLSGNYFIVVAASILGATAVGGFKAAQNVVGVTNIFLQGLENFAPIKLAKAMVQGGKSEMRGVAYSVALSIGSAIAVICLSVALIAPDLLEVLYGQRFIEYAYVLRWLCLFQCLTFFTAVLQMMLKALEDTKQIFFAYSISSVFSVATAYFIVSEGQLNGVVLGMITAQTLIITLYLARLGRTMPLQDSTR